MYRLIAPIFGRINLSFDNTYFLMASARYEGSSRFGIENRWGIFPAISAGVNIANLIDIPTVEDLKFRASYGVTGNLPGESYLSLLRFGPRGFSLVNGDYVPVYAPVSNPNPDLKWETKEELNFGIDFSILQGRLTGAIDYYTRTTKDLLIELPVSVPPNLFPTSILNVGELRNNGFELATNFRAINQTDFTWTPGVNITTFKTELVSLSTGDIEYGVRDIANLGAPGQNNTPLIRVEEGKPLGQIWGLVYDGLSDDGNYLYRDVNNDGVIDNLDRQVIGNGYPNLELGINNSFTYRNFDLNFFLRGAFGHNLVNTFRAFYETRFVAGNYNVVNTKHFDPNLTAPANFSSLHVEDASFLKLDNATIGYNFDLPQGGAFSRLRIYASGQNLFFITDYTGVDPEVRFADGTGPGANPLAPGIDRRNTWFRTRTYTFGLNVAF
jgi:iron complex outermembrane receptor protein